VSFNDIYKSLAIVYISLPNSVTPNDNELIFRVPLKHTDVGFARDHLLMVTQLLLGFVVEITK
jgi:hypothetical protein